MSKYWTIIGLTLIGLQVQPGGAQENVWTPASRNRWLPGPLRVHVSFELAWSTITETLRQNDLDILRQDRGQRILTSEFREYSSGTLVESHINKIAVRPKLIDAEWLRVRYQYEIQLELIDQRQTLVSVHTNIEALKREFLGQESWVPLPSSGRLEADLLTQFGRRLFGQNFTLEEPKKGFWEREPGYVPESEERIPRIPGPERPG